ncbi:aKG-HExxH-type peptide beta-hydroxylase [Streptomyces sp. NPDC050548]|uniref:aKG-HExxH-type peptide beta-hydroxylase n=1 Tax=Streptomyces sp. NPDC050548 TaxID=3365629 RepID=UPI0037A553CA
MAIDATTSRSRLPFHRLSAAGALALARGEGDAAAVGELLGAERSRRLLLLRALDDGLAHDLPDEGTTMPYAEAWELLERVQRQAPEVFESVLMAPTTGMWVSLTLRRIRGRSYEDSPLWVVAGYLTALAAAAGIRAGLEFEITVPVRRGLVQLPTIGCALLPTSETWSTARVVAGAGRVRIAGADGEAEVDPVRDGRGPAWLPVRRLRLGTGASAKELVLDELDPYRTYPGPSEPWLLSAEEAAEWESLLTEAWKMLLRDAPVSAEAMRLGLTSVAPTSTRERFRPYSGTAGDAFGGVTASRPHDPAQLAATLVHEFQHTKLGGLMHLGALSEPATDGRLFYAPWRDDPRPLSGLMQGIYAFHGVTRFWRTHRYAVDAVHAPMAHFEFALWRTQVWDALSQVRDGDGLTPLGRRVLEQLGECLERWLEDEVPTAELRLAEEAAADHRARWRTHHLRPPARVVEQAAQAWQRGDKRPPAALQDAKPLVVPDTEVRLLDGAAVLARHVLTDPDGHWRHFAGAGGVEGADEADVLLACGDRAAAFAAFAARLSAKGAPVVAWVGLGRSLPPDQAPAARLLLRFPERARAVQDALEVMTGRGADPVRLAAWLADGDRTRRSSV